LPASDPAYGLAFQYRHSQARDLPVVIPAKAGIQTLLKTSWIPACAGMTDQQLFEKPDLNKTGWKGVFRCLIFQHGKRVRQACCSGLCLEPEGFVLRIPGTEKMVIFYPVVIGWHALNGADSKLAQLTGIRQARIESDIIKTKFFNRADFSIEFFSDFPELAQNHKNAVAGV
jgi:hypothetical protein